MRSRNSKIMDVNNITDMKYNEPQSNADNDSRTLRACGASKRRIRQRDP